MEEQGLSASATGGQDPKMQELLMQVIQLLQQGVSPEEIINMGVPQEIVEYAMQMAQQGQPTGPEQGQPVVGQPGTPQ